MPQVQSPVRAQEDRRQQVRRAALGLRPGRRPLGSWLHIVCFVLVIVSIISVISVISVIVDLEFPRVG